MARIQLPSRVESDGTVSVKLPPGTAQPDQAVLVTVEPVESSSRTRIPADEWRRRIAETAGSITDSSFRRHDQGQLREPDSLE